MNYGCALREVREEKREQPKKEVKEWGKSMAEKTGNRSSGLTVISIMAATDGARQDQLHVEQKSQEQKKRKTSSGRRRREKKKRKNWGSYKSETFCN